jgi:hypothetical protein
MARCRRRGRDWLKSHSDAVRLPDYWSEFKPALAEGFHHRCGYSAMWIPDGQVDHYLSTSKNRRLAYEWTNYRFAAGWINQSKQALDEEVLDPFEVRDGWFEILLPSLQLVVARSVPAKMRTRAEFTLSRLNLGDDERVIRQRQSWYEAYLRHDLTLDELARRAPLIADAVRRQKRRAPGRKASRAT